ncbi:MAG: peptidyl-prolyl cis-trans isomerase [Chromatiaceae bacterium]|nr:peptidyl-prolyl cis-trans isomerase [Chromatiaceae bacterium]MCP5434222.1 peptidyl-prolyl cis-trans isomerase [Chromatiaceae bacterium]MCW5585219.1 peptidyl-prolyl cis-trans isomerase [Chromatiales bacterium]
MQIRIAPLLRDPLVGFVLAGSLIFLAYSHVVQQAQPRIIVTDAAVNDLVEERRMVLDREISPAERDELITGYVDHQVLVNEAIARGLYRNDANVRKRLADKMYFLLGEDPPEPNADQLQARFDAHAEEYLTPRSLTFEHVYFKSDRKVAERALAAIAAGTADAGGLGDTFWLGSRMERYSSKQLIVLFGFEFERALQSMTDGAWYGPLQSGRGWHLVRVLERHEPRILPDTELHQQLVNDWKEDWRKSQRAKMFAALRAQYDIILPSGVSGG